MDSQFPDDENGDVLRRMAAGGVDLSSPRVLDFEHCFPDEKSARHFFDAVSGTVLEARLIQPDPAKRTGWEMQCRQRMIPTHAAITKMETKLATVANRFGGHPDGWGTMSNPDGSPAE
jgi:hypothetical protein